MRKAASIARGACSETSDPSVELITRSKLMTPSPIVTGSISAITCLMRGSRQSNASLKLEAERRSDRERHRSCTIVPASTPIA